MALNWQTEYHRYRRYFIDLRRFYRIKKIHVYTQVVLSLLATSFFLFFAIKPTLVTITGLLREIKDKKLVVQKLEEKIEQLSLAQREYQLIQPELYLLDQALPKDSQISLLIKQIETLALKSGVIPEVVQYASVNLKGVPQSDKPEEISFSMTMAGGYQELKVFIESLTKLRRVILIKDFSFKPSLEEPQFLTLNLNVRGYFWEVK